MKRKHRRHDSRKGRPGSGGAAVFQRRARHTLDESGPETRISPKWAWHYRVLLALRERLMRQRGERLQSAADPVEAHSMDLADSATDEYDHDLALSELSNEQDALYEVDEALERIRSGTYGVCEETARPIPAERLRVIPWTRFRREAAEQLERRGVLHRPGLGKLGSVRGQGSGDLEESESQETGQTLQPEDESLHRVPSAPELPVHSRRVLMMATRPKPKRQRPVQARRTLIHKRKA